jgi:hypothetical protein
MAGLFRNVASWLRGAKPSEAGKPLEPEPRIVPASPVIEVERLRTPPEPSSFARQSREPFTPTEPAVMTEPQVRREPAVS